MMWEAPRAFPTLSTHIFWLIGIEIGVEDATKRLEAF